MIIIITKHFQNSPKHFLYNEISPFFKPEFAKDFCDHKTIYTTRRNKYAFTASLKKCHLYEKISVMFKTLSYFLIRNPKGCSPCIT